MTDSAKLADAFHDAINRRDIAALNNLMSEDHRFIDSLESVIEGKFAANEAWAGFFAAFPDYRNDVAATVVRGDQVLMVGHTRCSDQRLAGPALWRALVRGGKVAEWRVCPDSDEARRELGLGLV